MDAAVDKRDMILGAALALFVEKGFDGTAVPEIAARAGVGTGTLYRYFADKAGLVNALYRLWRGALDREALAPMPAHLTPEAQFALYWRRVLGWYRAHPGPARFLELQAHGAYLDGESRRLARAHPSALRAFLRAGMEAGTIARGAPEIFAALIQGAMVGLLREDLLDAETAAPAGARLWRLLAPG